MRPNITFGAADSLLLAFLPTIRVSEQLAKLVKDYKQDAYLSSRENAFDDRIVTPFSL
ncbi:hypothetical protein AB4Z19_13705 [Pseudoduganella sp. RAF19]|uniref:hypothetical protein n=1 Tax=Pseudoduganella sp. RAF19 TaxID=3233052 RepID=UPI003F99E22F